MRKQTGFSLIEFMVAITIGLFLVAIIVQVYIGSQQTYRSQDDLSRMQEEGRYAIEILGRYARIAGFRDNPNIAFATAFPVGSEPLGGVAGAAATNPDTLTLRHYGSGLAGVPDNTIRNCNGDAIDSPSLAYETFSLNSATKILECATPPVVGGVVGGGAAVTATLIGNVTNFKVTYGEDTDANGIPDKYVAAGAVTNMNNVLALRLCIELQSANDNLTTGFQSYPACSGSTVTAGDHRYHRAFNTTIALRNRLP